MTHRERVLAAVHHQEPDRVPLFYRDTPEVERRLLKGLGLPDSEALWRRFDIDFRWVEPRYVGPPLEISADRRRTIWGIEYRYVLFNETDGYWQAINCPLGNCDSLSDLERYPWPRLEWFDFSDLRAQTDRYADYAIMTAPGYSSPGLLQTPIQALVGDEKALVDMLVNPGFFEALLRHVMEFLVPFVDRMLESAGGRIDFFRIGDDYGTQNAPLMHPDPWRRFIFPHLRTLVDIAHRHGALAYLHSCGAVRQLIPHFIEAGVDVLDPLQVGAAGMVPAELKAEFGARLCFSGGVDEQELLRKGRPDDVRAAVRQLLDVMTPGGGFFLGPTHNFQVDIPTANIVALYDPDLFFLTPPAAQQE